MLRFMAVARILSLACLLWLQETAAHPVPGNIADAAETVVVPPEHQAPPPGAAAAPGADTGVGAPPFQFQHNFPVVFQQPGVPFAAFAAYAPYASSFTGHIVQHPSVVQAAVMGVGSAPAGVANQHLR